MNLKRKHACAKHTPNKLRFQKQKVYNEQANIALHHPICMKQKQNKIPLYFTKLSIHIKFSY